MKQLILLFTIMVTLCLFSCKEKNCYDAEMEANHPGFCTQDCPGVCGCDGKTYCNECIANSKGIAVVSFEPCESTSNRETQESENIKETENLENTKKMEEPESPTETDKSKKN